MAKKTLNEAVVRRFQKLANVASINEMYHKRDEDMMEADEPEMDAEMPEEKPVEMDAEMPEEESVEMDGDLELTDEEAQAIIDLGAKLEAAMGADMDMDGEEAPEIDMGAEEDMGEEELMEALRGISYQPSKGEIVNEVAKRVAKRLQQAKLHEAKLNRALGRRK